MLFGLFVTSFLALQVVNGLQSNDDGSSEIPSHTFIAQPPLAALPDMTNARAMIHPPGFAPPKDFHQQLRTDESMGFVVRRGTAKIMGYSRRKPAEELSEERR
ncbi:hypothetical protein GCK32_004850 [Trichostrongylus colubriformis]|uniref:Uncharacterized protein n=1 Tax=Trichostrongylus colubriformis TaxID=6319 RepID=A0AAN8F1N3_TRICO